MKKALKALALALAAAMMLTLAACGSTGGSENSSSPSSNPSNSSAGSPSQSEVEWPKKTVTIEIAVAAGGGTDTVGRILTNSWQASTGEAFTVINDGTGNGTVAYETVRNADPDGYTLLFYHSTMPIQYYQGIYDADPADPENFTVIANVVNQGDSDVLCVPASAPYDTLEEFVQYCKDNPGSVTFGNQNGGFGQLEYLLFTARAGIEAKFVDAGGQADTIISLLGGNIDACFIGSDAAAQYMEAGDMKALGICSEQRSPVNVPDVPTFVESGYDVVFSTVFVVLGPSGMDEALVEQINKTLGAAAEDQDVIDSLKNMGNGYTYKTVEESKEIWEKHCATIKEVCALAGYDVSNK